MKRGIVVPTFNERKTIGSLIDEVSRVDPSLRIMVVDDSSPDGTQDVVRRKMDEYPDKITLLTQPGKMGLGSAYIKGISAALEAGWDRICEMDADFSHQPKYLPELFRRTDEYDVVMGSRYVKDGGVENWSYSRRLLSRYGNLYARLVLGVAIRDLTSGFKCFRREVLESIGLGDIKSNGYSFQIETVYRSLVNGFRIKEVPIIFVEREQGQSKMSDSIVREAILMVWKLRFGRKRLVKKRALSGDAVSGASDEDEEPRSVPAPNLPRKRDPFAETDAALKK